MKTIAHPNRTGLLLLAALSFVLYEWVFDYVILFQYHSADSFFLFGEEFRRQWLDHPGGYLVYAGRFVRQFYHFGWLGALAVALTVTASAAAFHLALRQRRETAGPLFALLPGVALLALTTNTIDTALGVLVVSLAYVIYAVLPGGLARHVWALVLTPCLYIVVGGYVWLFVAWVVLSEWLDQPLGSGLPYKVLYPLLAACLPWIAYRWMFPVSLHAAVTHAVQPPDAAASILLYAYLLPMPLWARVPWPAGLRNLWRTAAGTAAQFAALALLAVGLWGRTYDASARHFADYHRLYAQERWTDILDKAGGDPSPSGMSQFFVNQALARQGRLLEEMFGYPQLWGTRGLVLSLRSAVDLQGAMYNSDLFWQMGHVNAAYRYAYNQVNEGKTYHNVRRVAECNIANGNYEIAEKYLNLLALSWFHGDDARRLLALLSDPGRAAAVYADIRALRPAIDYDIELGEFAVLLALARNEAGNRMALDYLSAWCLLDKSLIPVLISNLERYPVVGYETLPRHLQEALLVWERTIADRPLGLTYDPATRSRFEAFGQQIGTYDSHLAAQQGLKDAFGDSYMYYYAIATPPRTSTPAPIWVRLGYRMLAAAAPVEALQYCGHALRMDPNLAEAHFCMGEVLAALGRNSAAAGHFRLLLDSESVRGGWQDAAGQLRSH